jgi:UDP-glucose 4-epimerase
METHKNSRKRQAQGPVVAVTGVSGYVGQHLIRNLEREGRGPVVGIDMNNPMYAPPELKFYHLDVRQGYLQDILKREKIRTVVHLAFVLQPLPDTRLMHDINVNGTRNVLQAARDSGVEKVIIMSSTAVYGAGPENPPLINETAPLKGHPNFPYLRNQMAVEKLVSEYSATTCSPEIVVLRPCIIYGQRTQSFLLDFLRRMPFLPLVGGADPDLQFIHVYDLVTAVQHAIDTGRAGPYNIVSSDTIRYTTVAKILKKATVYLPSPLAYAAMEAMGQTSLIKGLPSYILDFITYSWVADGKKAERDLEFTARYSSREALESMLNS